MLSHTPFRIDIDLAVHATADEHDVSQLFTVFDRDEDAALGVHRVFVFAAEHLAVPGASRTEEIQTGKDYDSTLLHFFPLRPIVMHSACPV
jgi:hypothetical protein